MCDLVISEFKVTNPTTADGWAELRIVYTSTVSGHVLLDVEGPSPFSSNNAPSSIWIINLPLAFGHYTYKLYPEDDPDCVQEGEFDIKQDNPVLGCLDEYASNYDPAANVAYNASCTYAPTWRSAWGPDGMLVQVAAATTQVLSFIEAELRVGFRPDHPLAQFRPLGEPIKLTATIGPDGYARFHLGPFLRPLLGVPDGPGYRLDLNTQTVDDCYVGYELRRATGEMLDHGYAVNAAVPDAWLNEGLVLTSFAAVPIWSGFSWSRPRLASRSAGRFGAMDEVYPAYVKLACPLNPLPVAWLNPLGWFDYWVFSGRPQMGDTVGDGQIYTEATTDELRYSTRGASRATVQASSGVFSGSELMEGLRTLCYATQVWYQPVLGGDWVPVMIASGDFPAGRRGVRRQEVSVTFTESRAAYAQGQ
jgi:hypothetical protein